MNLDDLRKCYADKREAIRQLVEQADSEMQTARTKAAHWSEQQTHMRRTTQPYVQAEADTMSRLAAPLDLSELQEAIEACTRYKKWPQYKDVVERERRTNNNLRAKRLVKQAKVRLLRLRGGSKPDDSFDPDAYDDDPNDDLR